MITVLLFLNVDNSPAPSVFVLLLQFLYVVFIIFARPHKKMLDIVRATIIEIFLFYILLTRLSENQILNNHIDESSELIKVLSIFEIACYALADILSIISLIYHFMKKFSGKPTYPDQEADKLVGEYSPAKDPSFKKQRSLEES